MYTEHSRADVHGVELVDVTDHSHLGAPPERIWVGINAEGYWLTPAQAEQLAGALFGLAATHRARVSSKVPA